MALPGCTARLQPWAPSTPLAAAAAPAGSTAATACTAATTGSAASCSNFRGAAAPLSHQLPGSARAVVGPSRLSQLLRGSPPEQHALLVLLHAADSASLNAALLAVLLARAEELLSSSPDSLASAGGLGQAARCAMAIANCAGYLACPAAPPQLAVKATGSSGSTQPMQLLPAHAGSLASASPSSERPILLQSQPLLDVTRLLAMFLHGDAAAGVNGSNCGSSSNTVLHGRSGGGVASASNSAGVGDSNDNSSARRGWTMALAVPFAIAFLRRALYVPHSLAARSNCVQSAIDQLHELLAAPAMAPTHSSYCSLAACVSACVRSSGIDLQPTCHIGTCGRGGTGGLQQRGSGHSGQPTDSAESFHVLQGAAPPASYGPAAGGGAIGKHAGMSSAGRPADEVAKAKSAPLASLSATLVHGSSFVDDAYWAVCCPGLQALVGLLAVADAAHIRPQTHTPVAAGCSTRGASKMGEVHKAATGPSSSTCSLRSSPSSGGGGTCTPRHTTPLPLAPRVPPALSELPNCVTAALQRQVKVEEQPSELLQAALLGQYSAQDTPVGIKRGA